MAQDVDDDDDDDDDDDLCGLCSHNQMVNSQVNHLVKSVQRALCVV